MKKSAASYVLLATCKLEVKAIARNSQPVARSSLPELLQEPHVTLKNQLNIIHAIFQNRNPFYSHPKRESRNVCRVIIHEAINIGINHAAAEQLNPSAGLAIAA